MDLKSNYQNLKTLMYYYKTLRDYFFAQNIVSATRVQRTQRHDRK